MQECITKRKEENYAVKEGRRTRERKTGNREKIAKKRRRRRKKNRALHVEREKH